MHFAGDGRWWLWRCCSRIWVDVGITVCRVDNLLVLGLKVSLPAVADGGSKILPESPAPTLGSAEL